jgi:putative Mn2+ efflux pump MntP
MYATKAYVGLFCSSETVIVKHWKQIYNNYLEDNMGIFELAMIGVGLSMDAFAVAICKGLGMKKVDVKYTIVLALFFGGFQALMPLAGWLLGSSFQQYITAVDHWIAFALLVFLGGKMLFDVIKEKDEEIAAEEENGIDLKEFFMLAVATSIDALAVGITFAFLQVRILPSVTLIGCITFCFSVAGVFIGNAFGSKFKNKATILGGIILIGIGVKILVEHLGLL